MLTESESFIMNLMATATVEMPWSQTYHKAIFNKSITLTTRGGRCSYPGYFVSVTLRSLERDICFWGTGSFRNWIEDFSLMQDYFYLLIIFIETLVHHIEYRPQVIIFSDFINNYNNWIICRAPFLWKIRVIYENNFF